MKKFLSIICALLTMIFTLAVCTSAAESAKPTLSKTTLTIVCGVNYSLKVSNVPKGTTVKWSSSDPDIAGVTTAGKVLTRSYGTATISAKVGSTTLKCKVKVIPGTVKFEQSSYTVPLSEKSVINATVKGSKSVGLKNSNQKVATVKMKAWQGDILPLEITPVKEGTITVTLYMSDDKSIAKSIKVTVKNGAASINTEETAAESNITDKTSDAEQVLYYVNIEREKAGVAPLKLNEYLCSVADTRAEEITGLFSHERPDGTDCFSLFKGTAYENKFVGENIAAGYSSAEDTVAQWMASQLHRENILNPNYKYLGAAHAYAAKSDYKNYWVQIFSE
ncbi:MAG: CAP domain-containing protein [Oscillospiraceae bacterium]